MYKLVIIDDERDVRERLTSLVAKSGLPFELVAEYENGIDAYEGVLTENPDLIITDIKIPYIDGIELAQKVREVLPLVKIIVITGFDEFDYAKQAANLGVIGFISKPITREDMRAILKKAEESLDAEFVTASNMSRLQDFFNSNLPVLREADLYRLSNMTEIPAAFEKKLNFNEISLDFRYSVFCVFDFDQSVYESNAETCEMAFWYIRQLISDGIGRMYTCDIFNRYDKLCLIIKSNTKPDIQEIERQMERYILRIGRYSETPLSVGISSVAENCRNFLQLRNEATHALEYRRCMGGEKVFFFGDAAHDVPAGISIDDNTIRELGYILRTKSAADCIAALDAIRKKLSAPDAQVSYHYVVTGILNALLSACEDSDLLYARVAGPDEIYQKLFLFKTADDAFQWFEEIAVKVREVNDSVIVGNVDRNLERVIGYLETHFRDPDISFETMAREVNFSVSYICALLKKYMNTTFVKHLTMLRMEEAKQLLMNAGLKIADVADQLGYADPYYFSHCFKKYTGMSPKEFRGNA